MLNRDIVLAEVQKLALILARLVGLKEDGKQAEFTQLAEDTALKEYDITWDSLLDLSPADFAEWLSQNSMSADKLDAFAQLLYLHSEPFNPDNDSVVNLQKILLTYDLLEQKHHRQSLDNINRRKQIEEFLSRP